MLIDGQLHQRQLCQNRSYMKHKNHVGFPKPKHTTKMYIWVKNNSVDQEAIFENTKLLMTTIEDYVIGGLYAN